MCFYKLWFNGIASLSKGTFGFYLTLEKGVKRKTSFSLRLYFSVCKGSWTLHMLFASHVKSFMDVTDKIVKVFALVYKSGFIQLYQIKDWKGLKITEVQGSAILTYIFPYKAHVTAQETVTCSTETALGRSPHIIRAKNKEALRQHC